MTSVFVSLEDLPPADEQLIRDRAELIAMAEELGLANALASGNRPVVSVTDHFQRLGTFALAEEASYRLGRRSRVYSDGVLKNPGASPDLLAATPL